MSLRPEPLCSHPLIHSHQFIVAGSQFVDQLWSTILRECHFVALDPPVCACQSFLSVDVGNFHELFSFASYLALFVPGLTLGGTVQGDPVKVTYTSTACGFAV